MTSDLLDRRRSGLVFARTVSVSLVLHLAAALVLLLPAGQRFRSTSLPAVDLAMEYPVPAAVPTPAPALAAVPVTNAQAVPEVSPPPVPTPVADRLETASLAATRGPDASGEAVRQHAIGLGMLTGQFGSFAEGESLKDDIREYYFTLMRRVNEVWWLTGAERSRLAGGASITMVITREGRLASCELLESSGDRAHDHLLLETLKKAEPLPPLPASYRWPTFNAPVRFIPPLGLMLPGAGRARPLAGHGR
jgi:protein TonB